MNTSPDTPDAAAPAASEPHSRDGAPGRDDAGIGCSAKGCRAAASWVLVWNNPKLHTPERRKTWAACEDHRVHLADFLAARGFLREVVPLQEWSPSP
jgi:hypothetical protein